MVSHAGSNITAFALRCPFTLLDAWVAAPATRVDTRRRILELSRPAQVYRTEPNFPSRLLTTNQDIPARGRPSCRAHRKAVDADRRYPTSDLQLSQYRVAVLTGKEALQCPQDTGQT